jgi:hypothetical protein
VINPATALARLPPGLRGELLRAYNDIVRNYREGRWEPSELNGGKFSEVVYSILRGHADGSFPAKAKKPKSFPRACEALETAEASFPHSVRVLVPKVLIALYDIRNTRSVGHIGGEVDPNRMDATAVLHMAGWVMAELVRIFHGGDTAAATLVVDALTEREIPLVWDVAGRKRVLDTTLKRKPRALVLIYATAGPVSADQLADWMEEDDVRYLRRDVLRKLHTERLIEFDEESGLIHLSPTGTAAVENDILGPAGGR